MVDLDRDGDVDLFVANDTVRNFLFRNNGDGTFEEVGAASGVAYDGMGSATGAMGIDVADLRNENRLAFGVGNFANEMTSLYSAQPGGPWQFTDESIVDGLGGPSRLALSFGLFFFDYDLDGRLHGAGECGRRIGNSVLEADGRWLSAIGAPSKTSPYTDT